MNRARPHTTKYETCIFALRCYTTLAHTHFVRADKYRFSIDNAMIMKLYMFAGVRRFPRVAAKAGEPTTTTTILPSAAAPFCSASPRPIKNERMHNTLAHV